MIEQANQLVQDFLHDSQIFFDQAQFALTKKKEKDVIELVYKEITKIDEVLGPFEVHINQELELIMEEWIHKSIFDLEQSKVSQYLEKDQSPSFKDASTRETNNNSKER